MILVLLCCCVGEGGDRLDMRKNGSHLGRTTDAKGNQKENTAFIPFSRLCMPKASTSGLGSAYRTNVGNQFGIENEIDGD